METHKPVEKQGLLDALESLGAALSVVSISVDMVREELQSVLSVLTANGQIPPPANDSREGNSVQPNLFAFPDEIIDRDVNPSPPIYLIDGRTTSVAQHEARESKVLTLEKEESVPLRIAAAAQA